MADFIEIVSLGVFLNHYLPRVHAYSNRQKKEVSSLDPFVYENFVFCLWSRNITILMIFSNLSTWVSGRGSVA